MQVLTTALALACSYVLKGLVAANLVSELPPKQSGKTQPLYLVANRYYAGEPFAKPAAGGKRTREADEEADEDEDEDLADIEIERKKNIARNQEILRQLGLL